MMMHTELQAVLRQRQSRSRNFSKQSNDYTDDEDLGLPKSLQNSPGREILNNGFIISVNMGNFQVIFPMTWWGARSYGRVDPGVLAGITAPAATTPFSASTATTTRLTMMSFIQLYLVPRPYMISLFKTSWEENDSTTMQILLDYQKL